MTRRVIVIGAGFAGLSAAAYAAQSGAEVIVLEATDQIGGRARVVHDQGFIFELGPSWYLMPDVFEEWFADFGHQPSDFYELCRLDPSYQVITDHDKLTMPADPVAAQALFAGREPGAGQKLGRLLRKTAQEYVQARSGLLQLDGLQLRQACNPAMLSFLLRPELARSYHGRIRRYVRDPDLQHILEFMTVFLGGGPHNIPAFYSLLAHVDMNLGVWYPMGGFGAVARGMAAVAKAQGARIQLGQPVEQLEVEKGSVVAVRTKSQRYECDQVIATADYQLVETRLLPPSAQTYPENYWRKQQLSPSALLVAAGVKKRLPQLAHHNLFFDTDWDRHFRQVFSQKQWSEDPLFYVGVPSRTDPSMAPKGQENLFFLAPQPAGVQPTPAQVNRTVQRLLDRVAQAAGPFAADLKTIHVFDQQYFTDTFQAYQGNAFGLAHTLRQSALLRPRLRSKKVSNLFYAGQYTNPGTGVPMVIQSGKLAARLAQDAGR